MQILGLIPLSQIRKSELILFSQIRKLQVLKYFVKCLQIANPQFFLDAAYRKSVIFHLC